MDSIVGTLCAKSRMLSSHLTAVGLYSKIIFNEKAILDVFLRTLAQHCTSRPADIHWAMLCSNGQKLEKDNLKKNKDKDFRFFPKNKLFIPELKNDLDKHRIHLSIWLLPLPPLKSSPKNIYEILSSLIQCSILTAAPFWSPNLPR